MKMIILHDKNITQVQRLLLIKFQIKLKKAGTCSADGKQKAPRMIAWPNFLVKLKKNLFLKFSLNNSERENRKFGFCKVGYSERTSSFFSPALCYRAIRDNLEIFPFPKSKWILRII